MEQDDRSPIQRSLDRRRDLDPASGTSGAARTSSEAAPNWRRSRSRSSSRKRSTPTLLLDDLVKNGKR